MEAAHINAVTMFTPLLERFPILRQVDVEQSDFVLTTASVFMAATRLNNLRLAKDRGALHWTWIALRTIPANERVR